MVGDGKSYFHDEDDCMLVLDGTGGETSMQ